MEIPAAEHLGVLGRGAVCRNKDSQLNNSAGTLWQFLSRVHLSSWLTHLVSGTLNSPLGLAGVASGQPPTPTPVPWLSNRTPKVTFP